MSRLLFFLIGIFVISCNSNKNVFQENPPFEVAEASFQKWFGGTPESGKGIHFTLIFSEISEEVLIQKIYFRGKEEELKQNPQNTNSYMATFVDKPKEDVVLDSNPVKEMDNPRPSLVSEIPFELKANEAVIQYQKDNKIFYYKIENITDKDEVAYPSSKPDDN